MSRSYRAELKLRVRYHGLKATRYFSKWIPGESDQVFRDDLVALNFPLPGRTNISLLSSSCVQCVRKNAKENGPSAKKIKRCIDPPAEIRASFENMLKELSIVDVTLEYRPHPPKPLFYTSKGNVEDISREMCSTMETGMVEEAGAHAVDIIRISFTPSSGSQVFSSSFTQAQDGPSEVEHFDSASPVGNITGRTSNSHDALRGVKGIVSGPALDLSQTNLEGPEGNHFANDFVLSAPPGRGECPRWDSILLERLTHQNSDRNSTYSSLEGSLFSPPPSPPQTTQSLSAALEKAHTRIVQIEGELDEERRKRWHAEAAIQDIRRECRTPFIVPSLLDAFVELSRLTTDATTSIQAEALDT